MKCLISVSMRTSSTHLLRGGQEVLCLLLAGLLHHLIEDALRVLQEGVGRVVGLDLPRVEHLAQEWKFTFLSISHPFFLPATFYTLYIFS